MRGTITPSSAPPTGSGATSRRGASRSASAGVPLRRDRGVPAPGRLALLYTDGITDARNLAGRGLRRGAAGRAGGADPRGLSADEIVRTVADEVARFTDGADQSGRHHPGRPEGHEGVRGELSQGGRRARRSLLVQYVMGVARNGQFDETVRLTIGSRLEHFSMVHASARRSWAANTNRRGYANALLIAVIEAGTNAIQHGNCSPTTSR